jgi:hypothetical protein
MTKAELIKILEDYPDDTEIILNNPYSTVFVEAAIAPGYKRALRITDDSNLDD